MRLERGLLGCKADSDDEFRSQSPCAMEEMGAGALRAVGAVNRVTNGPSVMVQRVAARALRALRSGPGE